MKTKNKTPAEVENVTITMSRKTAEAVKQACEEYLRLRMGQFEDFTNEVCCWDYVEQMEKECHTTEERKNWRGLCSRCRHFKPYRVLEIWLRASRRKWKSSRNKRTLWLQSRKCRRNDRPRERQKPMVKPEPWENPMLDAMWHFMEMGGLKANYPALKEACMEMRQMIMQKTAGQRKDRPKDIPWENWERVKVTIICEAMALVLSGEYEPKEEGKSERKTAG